MGYKLLIFPLEQIPEMGRGRGVTLQKSKGDQLRDAQAFKLADGLPWANRVIDASELKFWRGERAQAGRMREGKWPKKNFKGE
jgi:topoisomerase-4 subunit A